MQQKRASLKPIVWAIACKGRSFFDGEWARHPKRSKQVTGGTLVTIALLRIRNLTDRRV